ncbi:bifunctional PIG-L family deacetylase/class I SAM-dependent methyltransferase [Gryllotalpicola protaetiae]|uniref:bifunctional PIG-L family deacetylase/class I SAM-dependent methyltransferase n=1 Tax=Gryllotalpicola protaetiae TaxID=2419771 RepID=UPI001FEC9937|nr:bifunctional PIG-L family deacetylase/class I SAM-dependent methyltransferase [Gryllotalpicola protaetiae]
MTFTHLDASTAEDAWQGSPRWQGVGELRLPQTARLVVLAAHPDDESLGAGALIARANRLGWAVDIVVATDGEASHPASPTHTPEQLRVRRQSELHGAVAALAPDARLTTLGLRDGGLPGQEHLLRAGIEAVIAAGDPPLLVAPWCADGHGDHEAVGRLAHELAAARGLRLLEYPIWLWHWAAPDSPEVPWAQLSVLHADDAERAAKRAATGGYVSQTYPLSDAPGDEAMLGPEIQRHFDRSEEVYVEHGGALPARFFDEFYDGNADPWGFETRWYEERKRAVTLAALPRPTFGHALELGCATGVLTAQLAPRVEELLSVDISAEPLARARRRVNAGHVSFERLATPGEWPDGEFDLIVLSEVGYYWGDELALGIERMLGSLSPHGALLACHWRHPVAEYPLSGDEVHDALRRRSDLVRTVSHVEEDFLLEVFQRPPGASVARETGLV